MRGREEQHFTTEHISALQVEHNWLLALVQNMHGGTCRMIVRVTLLVIEVGDS